MSKSIQLQEQELRYLHDTDFLTAKLRIQKRMHTLLEKAQQSIRLQQDALGLPAEVWEVPPKISRGENYEGLPYLVLDYPRIFQQESIFAFRTMLWWGWGFSCTLHLGGTYWQQYQPYIYSNLAHLNPQEWWLCVNNTPWEYHYRADNYKLLQECLQENKLKELAEKPFFKISRRLPLNKYLELPPFCLESLQKLAQLLTEPK